MVDALKFLIDIVRSFGFWKAEKSDTILNCSFALKIGKFSLIILVLAIQEYLFLMYKSIFI
jgi:hypothetical protein